MPQYTILPTCPKVTEVGLVQWFMVTTERLLAGRQHFGSIRSFLLASSVFSCTTARRVLHLRESGQR